MVEITITEVAILKTQMNKAGVDENCSSTWDIPPPQGWAPALIPPCPSPPRLDRSEHDGDEDSDDDGVDDRDEDYNDDGDDSYDSDAGGTADGDKEVTIWL